MFECIKKGFDKPSFVGTDAKLYIKGEYLYKIYVGKKSSLIHLTNLIVRQKYIKKTILPDRILYKNSQIKNNDENILLGCRIKYFNISIPLGYLNTSLDKKITIFEELIVCLKELLDNYIYPTDLHIFNILVDSHVRIIDLDTFDTKITDYEDKESYSFVLKLFRHVLLTTIFDDYDNMNPPHDISNYLKSKNLVESLIKDLTKENFGFEDANNFIYSLKK